MTAYTEKPKPLPGAVQRDSPVRSDHPNSWDLVLIDIAKRKQYGIEQYGVPVKGPNGRDALLDAYQEALDLVCYLRQALYEQEVTDE